MHPIERLRYVARATHVPPAILARETALALADFVGDDAGLLIACRRILDRQPTSGPLVWLAAHILGAPNQRQALWNAVEELEEDQTISALAYSLPDNPVVASVGWSEAFSDLARKRGDLAIVLIDTDGSAEYQVDRLIDNGHVVTVVDAEASAQALFEANHVIVNFDALGPDHGLAPMGCFPLVTAASHLQIPVWGLAGTGAALGERMYGGLVRRWNEASAAPRYERAREEVPVSLIDKVVTTKGLGSASDAVHQGGCPIVPELF